MAADDRTQEFRDRKGNGEQKMKDAKDFLRIEAMVLLGVFVFVVAVPFVLTLVFNLVGITVGIIGFFISLAVLLIKVAVVLAIGYLILVGIRALLR